VNRICRDYQLIETHTQQSDIGVHNSQGDTSLLLGHMIRVLVHFHESSSDQVAGLVGHSIDDILFQPVSLFLIIHADVIPMHHNPPSASHVSVINIHDSSNGTGLDFAILVGIINQSILGGRHQPCR
jgi:hypothetical protein